MRVLSVDLGTSHTVAVVSAPGRQPEVAVTMPSSVYCAEDGTLVVGDEAERLGHLDPSRFEATPKRRIDDATLILGGTVVPVTDALAAVLARVLEQVTEPVDEIRLTHPADWGPTRRNVLLSAARLAGMSGELVLVPESVAVASFAAMSAGQAVAVYDFGADTFDVAVVAATQDGYTVLADGSLADVGGIDIDQSLLEHVGRQVGHRAAAVWQRVLRPESVEDYQARLALQDEVRAAKEALSAQPSVDVRMPEPFGSVRVERTELEGLIRPTVLRSVELLVKTIRSAGGTPGQLAGIYVVGGSSRIPLVATMIAEQVRVVPTSLDQPEAAVALGTHRVPKDAISLREHDAPPPRPVEPPTVVTTPVNPTVSGSYSVSGSYPVNPSVSGSYPVTGPQEFNFPTAQVSAPRQSKKGVLIALGAAVVLVLGVVGGVLALGGPDLPSAQECKNDVAKDDKGFTKCLRQLAGTVPDGSTCAAAESADVSGVEEIKGTVVSCAVQDGYSVQYILTETVTGAEQNANAVVKTFQSDRVEARWAGNGLEGQYRAAADNGMGLLVFTAKDRPMFGIVTATTGEVTPDKMADFFAASVQPGT